MRLPSIAWQNLAQQLRSKDKPCLDNNYIPGPIFRIWAVSIFFCSLNRGGAFPFRKMVFIFVIVLDGELREIN